MSILAATVETFRQALSHLLPRGFAWPRDALSVQQRVVAGMAAALLELHQFTHASVEQWLPHRTCSRLEEWEEALGLPDACFGAVSDPILRRNLMLLRLRGFDLPFADSSAAAPSAIVQLCLNFGYVVNVIYDTWFRVYAPTQPGIGGTGGNGVGDRLGSAGRLYVDMSSYCEPMRTGVHGVGRRLIECSKPPEVLLCLLQALVPARFEIVIVVDGELIAWPVSVATPPPPPPPPPGV